MVLFVSSFDQYFSRGHNPQFLLWWSFRFLERLERFLLFERDLRERDFLFIRDIGKRNLFNSWFRSWRRRLVEDIEACSLAAVREGSKMLSC
jgi:hypothetical protein